MRSHPGAPGKARLTPPVVAGRAVFSCSTATLHAAIPAESHERTRSLLTQTLRLIIRQTENTVTPQQAKNKSGIVFHCMQSSATYRDV